jgi:hypothetical protein
MSDTQKSGFVINPHYMFLSAMIVGCLVTLYFVSILANRENIQMMFNKSFEKYVQIVQIVIAFMLLIILCYLVFEWVVSNKQQHIRPTVLVYSVVCILVLILILLYSNSTLDTLKLQFQKILSNKSNNISNQQQLLLQETFVLAAEAFNTSWFVLTGIVVYTILQFSIEYIDQLQFMYSQEQILIKQKHNALIQEEIARKNQWQRNVIAHAEASIAEAEKDVNKQQSEQLQKLQQELQAQRQAQTIAFREMYNNQIEEITRQFSSTMKPTDNTDDLVEQIGTFLKKSNVSSTEDTETNQMNLKKLAEIMKTIKNSTEKMNNLSKYVESRILTAAEKREADLIARAESLKIQNATTLANSLVVAATGTFFTVNPFLLIGVSMLCNTYGVTSFLATNGIKITDYLPTFTWPGWLPRFGSKSNKN